MKITLLFLILFLVDVCIIRAIKEPANFTRVKERYQTLREHISNSDDVEPHFKPLKNQVILTGFFNSIDDSLGYNVNKGNEIGLCLDGTPNEIFHVLIHELAHTVSSNYAHDEEFWENVRKLTLICKRLDVYSHISTKTEFCGSHIKDSKS